MSSPSKRLLEEGFFEFKQKAGPGLCWVKGCIRNSKGDRCLCHMHHMQRWRSKRPRRAAYATLKSHARGRKIEFTISVDYFKGLTDSMGYWDQKDPDEVLTIDRVKAHIGYVEGNLRVVSLSVNVIKGNKERYLPEHVQDMLRRERERIQADAARYLEDDEEEEDPF